MSTIQYSQEVNQLIRGANDLQPRASTIVIFQYNSPKWIITYFPKPIFQTDISDFLMEWYKKMQLDEKQKVQNVQHVQYVKPYFNAFARALGFNITIPSKFPYQFIRGQWKQYIVAPNINLQTNANILIFSLVKPTELSTLPTHFKDLKFTPEICQYRNFPLTKKDLIQLMVSNNSQYKAWRLQRWNKPQLCQTAKDLEMRKQYQTEKLAELQQIEHKITDNDFDLAVTKVLNDFENTPDELIDQLGFLIVDYNLPEEEVEIRLKQYVNEEVIQQVLAWQKEQLE